MSDNLAGEGIASEPRSGASPANGSGTRAAAPSPARTIVHVRAEPKPCVVCGRDIAPGQLYLVRGPTHVVCTPPARVDVKALAAAARQR